MSTERPAYPDAEPAAYACEWCPEDDEHTADGFSFEPDDPSGPWVPTCDECRTWHAAHEGWPND